MTATSLLTCVFKWVESTGIFSYVYLFLRLWIQGCTRKSSWKTWWWSGNHVPRNICGSLSFESGSGRCLFWKCIWKQSHGGVVFSNQRKRTTFQMLSSVYIWWRAELGLSTVGRKSRMYGTVIRVPSTVPADIWSHNCRSRYTAGCQPYFAVFWRPYTAVIRVSILNVNCVDYYFQTCWYCVLCGQRVFNYRREIFLVAVPREWYRTRDSVYTQHVFVQLRSSFKLQIPNVTLTVDRYVFLTKLYCR
jgi:hypothetical protein